MGSKLGNVFNFDFIDRQEIVVGQLHKGDGATTRFWCSVQGQIVMWIGETGTQTTIDTTDHS